MEGERDTLQWLPARLTRYIATLGPLGLERSPGLARPARELRLP